MYKEQQLATCAGADSLTIMLASGFGQHDGIALRSAQRENAGLSGVPAFGASACRADWRTDVGTTVSTFAMRIPTTVVRERLPLANAHVLGSPPRGAPV
jgi:hypothetical protein